MTTIRGFLAWARPRFLPRTVLVRPGERYPRGHVLLRIDPNRDGVVTAPWFYGIHLSVALFAWNWLKLRLASPTAIEKAIERAHEEGYQKGLSDAASAFAGTHLPRRR